MLLGYMVSLDDLYFINEHSSELLITIVSGEHTDNFTVLRDLFQTNTSIEYWRFQVTLELVNKALGWAAIDFQVNQPPTLGSCQIYPLVGNTSTSFTVTCSNWYDDNGISQYSVYGKFNGF